MKTLKENLNEFVNVDESYNDGDDVEMEQEREDELNEPADQPIVALGEKL